MRNLVLLIALAACGKAPYQAHVAPPQSGFQLVTPELQVPKGEEQMWCATFSPRAEDTLVTQVETTRRREATMRRCA